MTQDEIIEMARQPEQEPVAWVSEDVCKGQYIDGRPRKIWWECEKGVGTAFYTTPPHRRWVGLTDDQMEATFIECGGKWNGDFWKIEDADFHPFVRTIEAKIEKLIEILAQRTEQEPVACIVKGCINDKSQGRFVGDLCSPCHAFIATGKGNYSQAYRNTQRTWVGLTDDEIAQAIESINMLHGDYATEVAYAIEAKLKDKNS